MSEQRNYSSRTKSANEDNLIYLFHHIHHAPRLHKVHHCGGKHKHSEYTIEHCSCGLHRINKQAAIGDTINERLTKVKVSIEFTEECPDGGWHVESGRLAAPAVPKIG